MVFLFFFFLNLNKKKKIQHHTSFSSLSSFYKNRSKSLIRTLTVSIDYDDLAVLRDLDDNNFLKYIYQRLYY